MNSFSPSVKESYSNKTSASPINKIESEIDNTSELRNKNPIKSLKYGESLVKVIKELKSLEKLTDKSDVKYQMIADKLAGEILQCTISFFNEKTKIAIVTKEDADLILELIEFSEEISCGDQIKNRIKENKEIIEE